MMKKIAELRIENKAASRYILLLRGATLIIALEPTVAAGHDQ